MEEYVEGRDSRELGLHIIDLFADVKLGDLIVADVERVDARLE